MSVEQYIAENTVERIGAGIPLAALRQGYIERFGAISRVEFLAALARAGYTIMAPPRRPAYLVGRTLTKPAAA